MSKTTFQLSKTILLVNTDELVVADYADEVLTLIFKGNVKQEYNCSIEVANEILSALGETTTKIKNQEDIERTSGVMFPLSIMDTEPSNPVKETGLNFLHSNQPQ